MPSYTRLSLRQKLGREYLRDVEVGQTTGSWGATASLTVWASNLADLTLSGEAMYERAWIRMLNAYSSAVPAQDARVASFNVGSGAFHCLVVSGTTFGSGAGYEIHTLLSPAEKDRCLTNVANLLFGESEFPINSVYGAHVYSLPTEIVDVQSVRAFGWPVGSKNEVPINWWKAVTTGSGQELRIEPSLAYSDQLLLSAITRCSLALADAQTISLPTDEWILAGAAAQAYWLLERRGPSQETAFFKESRRELAATFRRLSNRFQPRASRKIQLEDWS
mgnify:CR=1 FL=1